MERPGGRDKRDLSVLSMLTMMVFTAVHAATHVFHAACGFGIKRFLLSGLLLHRYIALAFVGLHLVNPLSTGAAGFDLEACLGQGQTAQASQ